MSKHTLARTDVFRLKPFKWIHINNPHYECYVTDGSTGTYRVVRQKPDGGEWSPWFVKYRHEEHYNEGAFEVSSPDEGKAWCWNDWCERIRPHLIAHKPTAQ